MGRQLQILMNEQDENEFIMFLRSMAEIEIIESFAPTTNELWVKNFNPSFVGHHTYSIWNKDFAWIPEYGTVGGKAHDPGHIGWRYISNKSAAPLLEISRSNPSTGSSGRLYWAKDFAAPITGLLYDEESFTKWIDVIWRWVRKQGKKIHELPSQPYAFPGVIAQLAPDKALQPTPKNGAAEL